MSLPVDPELVNVPLGRFAVVPLGILQADLTPMAFRLWCALASFQNDEHQAWPSRRAILQVLPPGTRERTIAKGRSELVGNGLLAFETRTSRTNSDLSNLYTLFHPVSKEALQGTSDALGGTPPVPPKAPAMGPVGHPVGTDQENKPVEQEAPPSPPTGGNEWPSPQALVELYNSKAPDECPEVSTLSPARKKKARIYLATFPKREFWEEVCAQIASSRFLRGLRPGSNGHGSFVADFDWLLTKGKDGTENCVKVFEGKYHD